MAYGESSAHATDDVTLPSKVKLDRDSNTLRAHISTTARDAI